MQYRLYQGAKEPVLRPKRAYIAAQYSLFCKVEFSCKVFFVAERYE